MRFLIRAILPLLFVEETKETRVNGNRWEWRGDDDWQAYYSQECSRLEAPVRVLHIQY